MPGTASFPWWLQPANRLIVLLNRPGRSPGTMHILPIPGRKTGTLVGQEHARGRLGSAGRGREWMALVELPGEERPPADSEAFAQTAPCCPVFRLEHAP